MPVVSIWRSGSTAGPASGADVVSVMPGAWHNPPRRARTRAVRAHPHPGFQPSSAPTRGFNPLLPPEAARGGGSDPDDDLPDGGVAVAAHGGVEVVEPDDVAHQRGDLDPAAAHERDRGGPGVDVAEQALDAQLVALHPEQVEGDPVGAHADHDRGAAGAQ